MLVLALLAVTVCVVVGQYQANWESLNSRPLPDWYDEAKVSLVAAVVVVLLCR